MNTVGRHVEMEVDQLILTKVARATDKFTNRLGKVFQYEAAIEGNIRQTQFGPPWDIILNKDNSRHADTSLSLDLSMGKKGSKFR